MNTNETLEKKDSTLVIKNRKSNKWIWIVTVLVIFGAVVATIIILQTGRPENKVQRNLEEAKKYFSEMNYESAIAYFHNVIEINPQCVEAYLGIADAYVAIDELEKAVNIIAQGLLVMPDSDVLKQKQNELVEMHEPPINNDADGDRESDLPEVISEIVFGARTIGEVVYEKEWYTYNFSSDEIQFLESFIAKALEGDYDTAVEMCRSESMKKIVIRYGGNDGYYDDIQLVLNDYMVDIGITSDNTGFRFSIKPIFEGKGIEFSRGKTSEYEDIIEGMCADGLFNGYFEYNSRRGSTFETYSGEMVNELWDGTITCSTNFQGEMVLEGKYSNGRCTLNDGENLIFFDSVTPGIGMTRYGRLEMICYGPFHPVEKSEDGFFHIDV